MSKDGDRYFVVTYQQGRALSYSMELPEGTSPGAAESATFAEFPSDVQVVWTTTKDTCAQMEVQSATLQAVLGSPPIGDTTGQAIVETFTSLADGSSVYDPSNVNTAILELGAYSSPSAAPNC